MLAARKRELGDACVPPVHLTRTPDARTCVHIRCCVPNAGVQSVKYKSSPQQGHRKTPSSRATLRRPTPSEYNGSLELGIGTVGNYRNDDPLHSGCPEHFARRILVCNPLLLETFSCIPNHCPLSYIFSIDNLNQK